MATGRELGAKTIRFESPERLPYDLPDRYGSDFMWINMGLELLGERFGGRITFFSPVDIQQTMTSGNPEEIRAYCRKMAETLGRPEGGFIPRWYSDPVGAGHSPEALDAMCEEFLRLSGKRR